MVLAAKKMSEDSSEEVLNEPTKFEIQCKVCSYNYVSILKHLGQQTVCMEKYDESEIQELKKISLQNTYVETLFENY